MGCTGLINPTSSFMIPQLEDKESGFGLTKEEGSWLGKRFPNNFSELLLIPLHLFIQYTLTKKQLF